MSTELWIGLLAVLVLFGAIAGRFACTGVHSCPCSKYALSNVPNIPRCQCTPEELAADGQPVTAPTLEGCGRAGHSFRYRTPGDTPAPRATADEQIAAALTSVMPTR